MILRTLESKALSACLRPSSLLFQRHFSSSPRRRGKVIFSGIQPTGRLHLGNYLGAVRHWINLQNDEEVEKRIYCVVDLHAITIRRDPEDLRDSIYNITAELLGCGLDPNRCSLYCQSSLPEHAELSWILCTLSSHGKLKQLPQFKSKYDEGEPHQLGLLIYPVLQAADILLFHASHVPVGIDQMAHLNLTNSLRESFNNAFEEGYFPQVHPLIGDLPKVKSLTMPTKKMSKSDFDEKSRINILDSADEIVEKVKKTTTDSIRLNSYDPESRPGVANLIDLYAIFAGLDKDEAVTRAANMNGKVPLKESVAECVIEHLKPLREKTLYILENKDYIDDVLDAGADSVRAKAAETMRDVRRLVGFRKT